MTRVIRAFARLASLGALVMSAGALGCASSGRSTPPHQAGEAAARSADDADAGVEIASRQAAATALRFIEDDYERALAEARTRHVPLFVDAWATWCHSCMSLRSFVFVDPQITARAGDFVWLSLDTEKTTNAPFLKRFPLNVLPTLWIIDAETETPLVKWPGTLTAAELALLLDDTKSQTSGASQGDASSLLVRADRAAARGATDEAIAGYRAALAVAPAAWSRRGRLVDSLVTALEGKKDYLGCARLAVAEGPKLPPGTARVDVAVAGATCVLGPEGSVRELARCVPALLAELRTLTSDRHLPLVADDRSGAFEALVDLLRAEPMGPKTLRPQRELREAAEAWATFLEREAQAAPNAKARAVFDSHRLLAYLELHEPRRALPMLEQSAKDFPDDYNPHARLARALTELQRYDEAITEVDRALALAYGPRKLRIYVQKADIQAARHDPAAERAALAEALRFAKTIPLREGYERLRAQIDARLAR